LVKGDSGCWSLLIKGVVVHLGPFINAIVWALSWTSIVSTSWVVVVVALWLGHGLVVCFIVMSCRLSRGQLLSSCVTLSSAVVIVG